MRLNWSVYVLIIAIHILLLVLKFDLICNVYLIIIIIIILQTHKGTVLLKEFERDFNMKKDLDSITKLSPDIRYQRLRQFIDKITRNPDSRKDLDEWKMNFSQDVVKVDATVLPSITIAFANVHIHFNRTNFSKLSIYLIGVF